MEDKRQPKELLGLNVTISIAAASALAADDRKLIVDGLIPTLERLAVQSGRHVYLHVCETGTVHYPEDDPNTLHIVLGGLPPGDNQKMWAYRVDDIELDPNPGTRVDVSGIARGYGEIATDTADRRVAQLVGSTIYLCLPTAEDYVYLLAGNGVDLFRVALQIAWKAFATRRTVELAGALDLPSFVAHIKHERDRFLTGAENELRWIDAEVAELSKKINEHLLHRRFLLARMASYPEVICGPQEEIETDWEQLSQHHLVDFLERSMDDRLHVHTRDVLITDEQGGVRHLGRFIIRIDKFFKVAVWSKLLTHPKRRAHPHIGKFGSVCFGNVTMEIDRLLIEGSEAQVAMLVLAWLAEGYEPSLADAKLEEWPLVNELDPLKILYLPTTFCAPKRKAETEPKPEET